MTDQGPDISWISDMAALEALYGTPGETALIKVADRLTPEYRAWIEAAGFCAFATVGPEGLDCSPRGDDGPVVQIIDDRHLALPDRRGNNRIDSLRNILQAQGKTPFDGAAYDADWPSRAAKTLW